MKSFENYKHHKSICMNNKIKTCFYLDGGDLNIISEFHNNIFEIKL